MDALHEVDHRFTIEGRVCKENGEGIQGVKVIVKNTRASIGGSGVTDSEGSYNIRLHLHNDNQGDPLLIKALDYEANAKVDFDPNDIETERSISVNLGGECQSVSQFSSSPVLVGLGISSLAIIGLLGLKTFKKNKLKRSQSGKERRKGKRE